MRHDLASGPADLPALFTHWVTTGVITPEQAARMRADLRLPAKEHRPASLVIEALGYLGSVLIVVASILLASEYWSDLTTAGHLIVVGAAGMVLVLAGLAVPARLGPVGRRMQAVLWLGATIATAAFLGVFGDEVLSWHDEDQALLVFAGSAALAAVLWWRLPTGVQQAALAVGLAGAAAAAAAQFHADQDRLPGVATWGVGAIWFVLGWGGVLRPRWVALGLGGVALLVGAGMTMDTDGGIMLALVTVAALVTLAVWSRDLLVLGLGAWGALQVLPMAVNTWFPGELAAAGALLVAGVLLVAAAIWIARRRPEPATGASRGHRTMPVHVAGLAASGIAAGVTAVVLVLGLT